MSKRIDITGITFNKWTVLKYIGTNSRFQTLYKCKCECGSIRICLGSNIKNGLSKTCGCSWKTAKVTHGMSKTRIFKIWNNMRSRCSNPNRIDYRFYGGRGIKVCKRWHKFENFYKDMGDGGKSKSLDRINNNKNYSKENCRWSTRLEQSQNLRSNRILKFEGKKYVASEAARVFNINYSTMMSRLRRGWSIKNAIRK